MTSTTLRLGFIGAGRMATALARGCVEAGMTRPESVTASDPQPAAREAFAATVPGAAVSDDNRAVLHDADFVFLAVKPQTMSEALSSLGDAAEARHLFISIAAGVTLARLAAQTPSGCRLIRVMPNTPCLIGLGVSCFARGPAATDDDAQVVTRLLGAVGDVYEVDESQMDAVTGLSGSGPAFVYSMIEALAAGGVAGGLPTALALRLAVQTTRGAAEMVRDTELAPSQLRDQVTSPGGTTLAGLVELSRLRGTESFQAAVEAATRRSIELGQS